MKKLVLLLLATIVIVCSCKKDKKIDEITYEVTLSNSSTWHGAYVNENAQAIGVQNEVNNWKYSFKNVNDLSVAMLQAYADGLGTGADANMIIYLNGNLVASGKSSISPQVSYQFR